MPSRRKRREPKGRLHACDQCGERARTKRFVISINGRRLAAWRLCVACMAPKIVAAFGQGPTGVDLGTKVVQVRQRRAQ